MAAMERMLRLTGWTTNTSWAAIHGRDPTADNANHGGTKKSKPGAVRWRRWRSGHPAPGTAEALLCAQAVCAWWTTLPEPWADTTPDDLREFAADLTALLVAASIADRWPAVAGQWSAAQLSSIINEDGGVLRTVWKREGMQRVRGSLDDRVLTALLPFGYQLRAGLIFPSAARLQANRRRGASEQLVLVERLEQAIAKIASLPKPQQSCLLDLIDTL